MSKTTIEWTNRSWNPIRGCSVVSEGCRNCYAMNFATRFAAKGEAYEGLAYRNRSGAHWTGKVEFIEKHLPDPLKWHKPARVFVNSMSDLFHESIPDEWIDRILAVMALASQHTFQILTKRPSRMLDYMGELYAGRMYEIAEGRMLEKSECLDSGAKILSAFASELPHVWLGVSVEDQKTADERIPLLLQTPASVRWISAEPLLGPIDVSRWLEPTGFQCADPDCTHRQRSFLSETEREEYELAPDYMDSKGNTVQGDPFCLDCGESGTWTGYHDGLNWVVVGGESGPGARSMDIQWARSVVQQCQAAKVPVFVKQIGSKPISSRKEVRPWEPLFHDQNGREPSGEYTVVLKSRKGGDPAEWPEDLRIREYPEV